MTLSHISVCKLGIKSLTALQQACINKGLVFKEGQTTHKYYSGTGTCLHAITVPGAKYEIGIVQNKDGDYDLAYDPWSYGGLEKVIGRDANILMQEYGACVAEEQFMQDGYDCFRSINEDGNIIVTAQKLVEY